MDVDVAAIKKERKNQPTGREYDIASTHHMPERQGSEYASTCRCVFDHIEHEVLQLKAKGRYKL